MTYMSLFTTKRCILYGKPQKCIFSNICVDTRQRGTYLYDDRRRQLDYFLVMPQVINQSQYPIVSVYQLKCLIYKLSLLVMMTITAFTISIQLIFYSTRASGTFGWGQYQPLGKFLLKIKLDAVAKNERDTRSFILFSIFYLIINDIFQLTNFQSETISQFLNLILFLKNNQTKIKL